MVQDGVCGAGGEVVGGTEEGGEGNGAEAVEPHPSLEGEPLYGRWVGAVRFKPICGNQMSDFTRKEVKQGDLQSYQEWGGID